MLMKLVLIYMKTILLKKKPLRPKPQLTTMLRPNSRGKGVMDVDEVRSEASSEVMDEVGMTRPEALKLAEDMFIAIIAKKCGYVKAECWYREEATNIVEEVEEGMLFMAGNRT